MADAVAWRCARDVVTCGESAVTAS